MLIELEEDFIELKDKELKVRQIKIKNFNYCVYKWYG